MRNKLLYFLAGAVIIYFSACTPVKTEMWLNANGSGKAESTIDLGSMFSMIESMMGDMTEEADSLDREDKKMPEKMDSIMSLSDVMPDSIKEMLQYPELMENFYMRMIVDEAEEKGILKMMLNYDSFQDLEKIRSDFDIIAIDKNGMDLGETGGFNSFFLNYESDLNNGVLVLEKFNLLESIGEEDLSMEGLMDSIRLGLVDEETLEFFNMMFGDTIETTVHLPGKVLFTNDLNARIEGNTVHFNDNFMDQLKGEAKGLKGPRIIKYQN